VNNKTSQNLSSTQKNVANQNQTNLDSTTVKTNLDKTNTASTVSSNSSKDSDREIKNVNNSSNITNQNIVLNNTSHKKENYGLLGIEELRKELQYYSKSQ
jgi:hypothetical protein